MEKNNGKIVAVVALVIAVVSLSVGFAAFSATLTIESASATAKQGTNTFATDVKYTQGQTVTCYEGASGTTALTAGSYNGGTAANQTWTGVSVPLTTDVRTVRCEAEITNASAYVANLKQISIADYLTCASAGSGDAAATNVTDVCNTVTATVTIDSDTTTFTSSGATSPNKNAFTGTASTIAADNGTKKVNLIIAYGSGVTPDGDITITIPTISLLYKTN